MDPADPDTLIWTDVDREVRFGDDPTFEKRNSKWACLITEETNKVAQLRTCFDQLTISGIDVNEFDKQKGLTDEPADFQAACAAWVDQLNDDFKVNVKQLKFRIFCDYIYHDPSDEPMPRDAAAFRRRKYTKKIFEKIEDNLAFYLMGIPALSFMKRSTQCRKTMERVHYYLSGIDYYEGKQENPETLFKDLWDASLFMIENKWGTKESNEAFVKKRMFFKHMFVHITRVIHAVHPQTFRIDQKMIQKCQFIRQQRRVEQSEPSNAKKYQNPRDKSRHLVTCTSRIYHFQGFAKETIERGCRIGKWIFEDAAVLETHPELQGDCDIVTFPPELIQDPTHERFLDEMMLLLLDLEDCKCRQTVPEFLSFIYYCLCTTELEGFKLLKSQFTMVITGCGFYNLLGRSALYSYLQGILLSFADYILQEVRGWQFQQLEEYNHTQFIERELTAAQSNYISLRILNRKCSDDKNVLDDFYQVWQIAEIEETMGKRIGDTLKPLSDGEGYVADIHKPFKIKLHKKNVEGLLLLIRRLPTLDYSKPREYEWILRRVPTNLELPDHDLDSTFFVESNYSHNWWWYTQPLLPMVLSNSVMGTVIDVETLADIPKIFYFANLEALAERLTIQIERFVPVASELVVIWQFGRLSSDEPMLSKEFLETAEKYFGQREGPGECTLYMLVWKQIDDLEEQMGNLEKDMAEHPLPKAHTKPDDNLMEGLFDVRLRGLLRYCWIAAEVQALRALRAVKIIELAESGKQQGKWTQKYADRVTSKLVHSVFDDSEQKSELSLGQLELQHEQNILFNEFEIPEEVSDHNQFNVFMKESSNNSLNSARRSKQYNDHCYQIEKQRLETIEECAIDQLAALEQFERYEKTVNDEEMKEVNKRESEMQVDSEPNPEISRAFVTVKSEYMEFNFGSGDIKQQFEFILNRNSINKVEFGQLPRLLRRRLSNILMSSEQSTRSSQIIVEEILTFFIDLDENPPASFQQLPDNATFEYLAEGVEFMLESWRTLACLRHFSRLFPSRTNDQILELVIEAVEAFKDSRQLSQDALIELACRE